MVIFSIIDTASRIRPYPLVLFTPTIIVIITFRIVIGMILSSNYPIWRRSPIVGASKYYAIMTLCYA